MKIQTRYKIESAVSSDKYRFAITDSYLDTAQAENPVLVATDGHIMAVVPVEALPEEAGFITEAALKAARKLAKKNKEATILCNGTLALSDGTQLPRPTELSEGKSKFVQWRHVIDAASSAQPMLSIGLNATLLRELADAIGTDAVRLDIIGPLNAIRVSPIAKDNPAYGVIMPIKL